MNSSLTARLDAVKQRFKPRLGRLLAIASDGCNAAGAVIRAGDGTRLEIEAVATSRALKFEAVAEELVAGLKEQGVSLPRQAIVVTAGMMPAVLELPAAAGKPLSSAQMLEMIRWELEPLFAQQIGLWSTGSLLFGRGYLSDVQRLELLEAHQSAQSASRGKGGRLAAARIGELAIEKGFVTREQVEECLALQEELQMTDADMLIAWHGETVGSPGAGQSAWLCACLAPAVRTRWVEAVERLGLRLLGFYALAGASAPLAALSHWPVGLELHPLLGVAYRMKDGAVGAVNYRQFTAKPLTLGEALSLASPLLRPDDRQMGVVAGKGWEPALAERLHAELRRDVQVFDHRLASVPEDCPVSSALLAALAGGAAHALGVAPPASAVRLPGSPPPPPVYRRPLAWAMAAAAALLIAAGGFELSQFMERRALTARHGELLGRQRILEEAQREVESLRSAETAARQELNRVQEELAGLDLRRRFYEQSLDRRGPFMESLLGALIERVNDELLLESVAETGWQQVEVQGFSLNPEAVYRYARALAKALESFGVKLGDLDTGEAQGPMGLMGYRFSFLLSPTGREDAR